MHVVIVDMLSQGQYNKPWQYYESKIFILIALSYELHLDTTEKCNNNNATIIFIPKNLKKFKPWKNINVLSFPLQ
jgi:hypothetical protein